MKRVISLLISVIFLMSINVGIVSVDASSDSDVIMIEKTTTVLDLTDQTYTLANAGSYSTQRSPKVGNDVLRGIMFPIGSAVNNVKNTVTVDNTTFDEPALKYTYKVQQQSMNVQISWAVTNGTFVYTDFNEKVVVKFSGRTLNNVDGAKPSWTLKSPSVAITMPEALKKDTWYKFESVLDLNSTSNNFTVTYTEETDSNPHTITATKSVSSTKFTKYDISSGVGVGETNAVYYSDLKLEYDSVPFEKASIVSVGSDGVVFSSQNVIPLTLSAKIPGLAKEYVKVTNKETNEDILVNSINISGENDQNVNIVLESNLVSWSEYEIIINSTVFGDGAMQRVEGGTAETVTDITTDFETTKPPFAAKTFEFSKSGDTLNAKALVANTTGTPEEMVFVFTAFNSDGSAKDIAVTDHMGFNSPAGEYLEADITVDDAYEFNFFVIDNWTNKNPLFDAYYRIDNQGNYLSANVLPSGEEIVGSDSAMNLGEFNYNDIEISVNIDTKENKITNGILFVYKSGEALSSSNLPCHAEVISTASNGRALKNIVFPQSFSYGEYTVEFVSAALENNLRSTFNYYSPEELLSNKKADLLAMAKTAQDAEELSEILMGVNSAGEKVNNNFELFGQDADMTIYNKNTDKLNVFQRMLPSLPDLIVYDALVDLFESCATEQKNFEDSAQKNQLVADAKASGTATKLMKVILGIDDNEKVINTNFELISANADLTVYNSLNNKKAVFSHMILTVSSVTDFNNFIYHFEQAAIAQKNVENTPSKPSSNNSRPGGSSTPIRETTSVSAGDVTQQPVTGNTAVFADMNNHWASNYVESLYKKGIMKGYEDGTFRGENSITRAELAKTLVEAFSVAKGEGKIFADVNNDSWYSDYVARASSFGIVTGFDNGLFYPNKEVTRQDAVLMLYRAMAIGRTMPIGYKFFVDDLDIADYASGAIRSLGDLGIVGGNAEKRFLPNNSITRAEVATIICRAIDYIESH